MNKIEKKNRIVFWFTFGFLSFCFIVFLWYLIIMYNFFNPPKSSSDVPGYITFMEGFHKRMKESLDVVQIRDWLNTLSEEEIDKLQNQQFSVNTFPIKLPDEINNLKSEMSYIILIKNDQDGICLRMIGGGPVGHWGVVIGPKEMPTPETEDFSYDKDGYIKIGEYRLKLEDGAYVWHDIH